MIIKVFKYLICVALLCTIGFLTVKTWIKRDTIQKNNLVLQKDLLKKQEQAIQLQKENQKKRENLSSLHTNIESVVEEKARESFGMVRDGETFFYDDRVSKESNQRDEKEPQVIEASSKNNTKTIELMSTKEE